MPEIVKVNEKLLRLKEWIEQNVKPKVDAGIEKFNMAQWATGDLSCGLGVAEEQCGSAGCLLGWATEVPEFKAAGLALFDLNAMNRERYPDEPWAWAPKFTVRLETPSGEKDDFDAGREFFGISEAQAFTLFDPEHYPQGSDTTLDEALARLDAVAHGAEAFENNPLLNEDDEDEGDGDGYTDDNEDFLDE